MGQKINSNIFNLQEKRIKQSSYIEKRLVDHSILLKTDIEIKNFTQIFFKTQRITVNNCKLIYLNSILYIYVSYYQKIKEDFLAFNMYHKAKIIQNCFKKKESEQFNKSLLKKTVNESWKRNKAWSKYRKREAIIRTNKMLEMRLFLETFFMGLINFISNKYCIYLILERQNKKLNILKHKFLKIKRKQKVINLRKYKRNQFFKEGINLLTICLTHKNSSILLAKYLASQLQILKHQNFFLRFIKNALILLNNKVFFSKIKGIKIKIKGRFNGNSRAKNRIIQISRVPSFLKKCSNICHFEEISFTHNGTFSIKVWIFQN